jgi:formyl-CoA transferase/CoA:oxalate CoA-transferase
MESHTPLDGIKVLDLTQAMAGPMATMLLGDIGAEIVKVEPPAGDQSRSWAPPFLNGISAYFLSVNRNKKSMVLDLKSSETIDIMKKLIAWADVLVENFRPGTMEKLGLSYGVAKEINPRLIYCSLSGYGQNGPQKDWPGYDLTVLANSGFLSINAEEGRSPIKPGVPIADIISGLMANSAILGALYERKTSGIGQYIDMSMLDANFLILTNQLFGYFATGKNPRKLGSAHSNIAPYQVFSTGDGFIAISVGTDKLWNAFCNCISRHDLIDHPLFIDNARRVQNREKLVTELERTFDQMTTSDLFKALLKAGIPAAPINSIEEAANSPQIKAREMLFTLDSPYGKIPMTGTPFKMSRTPGKISKAPPLLGEDTESILASIGYNPDQIADMLSKGIINANKPRVE